MVNASSLGTANLAGGAWSARLVPTPARGGRSRRRARHDCTQVSHLSSRTHNTRFGPRTCKRLR